MISGRYSRVLGLVILLIGLMVRVPTTLSQDFDFTGRPDDRLDYFRFDTSASVANGAAGRYYVQIYTETPHPAETRTYSMLVNYP